MKAVVRTYPCANFLNHLDFRLFIFSSNSPNQDEFTFKFISRRKFIFLVFEKAVQILSFCKFSWSFGLQPWCTGSIYSRKPISLPINEGSCWNLPLQVLISLTIWISDCLFLAHIVEIRLFSLSVFFETEVYLPIFWESCSKLELMQILLIIWFAVMVHRQYFI